MSRETIFAFASGAGRAAIGVFRLSGPNTADAVQALTGSLPSPRHAHLTDFIDPASHETLDRGLVLWFPGPASFTGEDAAEFHIHGGRATTAALARAFGEMPGLRPAGPGEFTRRALSNGKLDLSSVEGLADLIDAETDAQRRQALRQVSGALRDQALRWRERLLEAAALIEGEIDFSEEADVPKAVVKRVGDLLSPLLAQLKAELAAAKAAERIRDGLTIVIAGPPNAGKSTLMNALARREVAIVSEYAGTTRDLLEVHLDIEGLAVTLIDTAGLRDSTDPVEQIGVARAREQSRDADLVLWLSEARAPVSPDMTLVGGELWAILTKSDLLPPHPEERASLAIYRNSEIAELASRRMEIRSLEDSPSSPFETAASQPPQGEGIGAENMLTLSAATGENLDKLITRLGTFAKNATLNGEAGLITRERHRQAFSAAVAALARILADLDRPIEFLAEDLRLTIRSLESLIGGVDVEDVLGDIFSRFCVGK